MSCVREVSPPLPDDHRMRHDLKKRRFLQPLRGLRRIFRKKGRPVVVSAASDGHVDAVNELGASNENLDLTEQVVDSHLEPDKSHSTSHLDDDQADNTQRRSFQSTLLSVSHDSVFTSEQRTPDSGSETSLYMPKTRLGFTHSSVRAELFEAVRKRRTQENNVSDDEDLGLPRSPVSNSPTTADDVFTKENMVTKSSQSTCSDGSLLSMGSSEIDEESYCYSSRHSSKLSLYEKRISTGSDIQHNNDRSTNSSNDDAASLSHSAAKHKMAVKPKRNHGAPHKKRQIITSNTLPTTPEVNEESNQKCIVAPTKEKPVADSGLSDEYQTNQNHHHKMRTEHHTSVTQITVHEQSQQQQPRYCSLPLSVSLSPSPSMKLLTRSKSNATSPMSPAGTPTSDDDKESAPVKKEEGASFFSRLLLRRSSKKKKNLPEDQNTPVQEDEPVEEHVSLPCLQEEPVSMSYVNGGLTNAMRHHPLFRQRVEPLNLLPKAPHETQVSYSSTVPVNMTTMAAPVATANSVTGVQKSHSFRNGEKLPYSLLEDTPSLPANIGLAQHGELEERFRKRSSRGSREASDTERVPVAAVPDEADVGRPYSARWKLPPTSSPPRSSPDYENMAAVNRLSISVNENIDGPVVEVATEGKQKTAQVPDLRIPVPAPRTSLLNRTPSQSELIDRSGSSSSATDSINVTVTESADGQRSIISISSNDFPIECMEAEMDESALQTKPSADDPMVESKSEDLEDDVFQLQAELPIESSPATTPLGSRHVSSETEVAPPPPISVADEVMEKSISRQVADEKPPREPELPPKPVIVTDLNAGTIKVNDTTVFIRKKVRDVTRSKRDEEPELMKVFARRSLKLKETDSLEEEGLDEASKRDSDKENEDSINEEQRRKKNEAPDSVLVAVPPKPASLLKFQRSVSHDVENKSVLAANVVNEKRQRCKSIPNEMEKCPSEEKRIAALSLPTSAPTTPAGAGDDKAMTPFKRIQQRREEWEKRAQLAMKVQGTR